MKIYLSLFLISIGLIGYCNSATWNAVGVGSGITDSFPYVYALLVNGTDIYVAGTWSTPSGNILK
jgi:hypothetical protein